VRALFRGLGTDPFRLLLALLDPRTAHGTSRGPQPTRCVGLFPAVPAADRDCNFTLTSTALTVLAMSFVDDAAFSREDLYHLQHHRDVNQDGREGLSSTFGLPPPFFLGGTRGKAGSIRSPSHFAILRLHPCLPSHSPPCLRASI